MGWREGFKHGLVIGIITYLTLRLFAYSPSGAANPITRVLIDVISLVIFAAFPIGLIAAYRQQNVLGTTYRDGLLIGFATTFGAISWGYGLYSHEAPFDLL